MNNKRTRKNRTSVVIRFRAAIIVAALLVVILTTTFVIKCVRNKNQTARVSENSTSTEITQEISSNDITLIIKDAEGISETEEEIESEEQSEEITESETETEVVEENVIEETFIEEELEDSSQDNSLSEENEDNNRDFVSYLNVSSYYSQLIIVSAHGTTAEISMHQNNGGIWKEILSTSGYVGRDGVGQASEYASRTPAGVYTLTRAFGNKANPGTALSYTWVDDSYYWVDDVSSWYYNQFVSTNDVQVDWNSAEHIADYPTEYAYALAINCNTNCVPGNGSAIFLHCTNGRATAGCVSVSESAMVQILRNIGGDCAIVIDYSENIMGY